MWQQEQDLALLVLLLDVLHVQVQLFAQPAILLEISCPMELFVDAQMDFT